MLPVEMNLAVAAETAGAHVDGLDHRAPGADQSALAADDRPAAGDHRDVGGGERGAFDCAVFGGAVEEVSCGFFRPFGAAYIFQLCTHSLRCGLQSFATSRLSFGCDALQLRPRYLLGSASPEYSKEFIIVSSSLTLSRCAFWKPRCNIS